MQQYPPPVYQPPPGAEPWMHLGPPPARELPFTFTGSAKEYFRIWIVNVALTIVTLGIYSAWAKVRTRQYFYRHTWVEGSSFDYLGDPVRILKGRLIIGAALGVLAASQYYSPVLYGVLFGLFVLSTPAVLVKALQFNARNSAYRNVRFSFMGNIGESYGVYLLVLLIYVVTCGVGYPYAQWRFTRFVVERHLFGDERFQLSARADQYFRIYLLAFLMIMPFALLVGFGFGGAMRSKGAEEVSSAMPVVMAIMYAYLLIPGTFIKARTANLLYNGLWIGPHHFLARQRMGELLKLYIVNLLAIALSLGLLIPWAKIRLAQYRASRLTLIAEGDLEASLLDWQARPNALGDAATDLGEFDFDIGL